MPVKRRNHIGCICLTFLHGVFSNVVLNYLHKKMQRHIGCICLIFLQNEYSNVISNFYFNRCKVTLTSQMDCVNTEQIQSPPEWATVSHILVTRRRRCGPGGRNRRQGSDRRRLGPRQSGPRGPNRHMGPRLPFELCNGPTTLPDWPNVDDDGEDDDWQLTTTMEALPNVSTFRGETENTFRRQKVDNRCHVPLDSHISRLSTFCDWWILL